MRESPSPQGFRPSPLYTFTKTVGVPFTFAVSVILNASAPPSASAQQMPSSTQQSTEQDPGVPEERVDKEFLELFDSLEADIAELENNSYGKRENAKVRILETSRKIFSRMNPLSLELQKRWNSLMNTVTLHQREELKSVIGTLRLEGIFVGTRIPVDPKNSMLDLREILQRQTGITLDIPELWKDIQKILDALKGKNAIEFAPLLLLFSEQHNVVPELSKDGMTIRFHDNTGQARLSLENQRNLRIAELCTIDGTTVSCRVILDPLEYISDIDRKVVLEQANTLVQSPGQGRFQQERIHVQTRPLRQLR